MAFSNSVFRGWVSSISRTPSFGDAGTFRHSARLSANDGGNFARIEFCRATSADEYSAVVADELGQGAVQKVAVTVERAPTYQIPFNSCPRSVVTETAPPMVSMLAPFDCGPIIFGE